MIEATPPAPAGSVVVTFALPEESRLFLPALADLKIVHRGWPRGLPTCTGRLGARPVTIVHTGVGDTPTGRERLRAALAIGRPGSVISAGYAGGLVASLAVGDLVLGRNFSDPGLAQAAHALLTDGQPVPWLRVGGLASRDRAAETVADKAALLAETHALAVDMETHWIAEVCAESGVPLLSLRVISDAANQPFPVPGRILFDAVRQRPRYLALPAWLLMHPGRIAPFAAFVRGLGPARARLTRALQLLGAHL